MSSEQDLSPEEKLLKVIQQAKQAKEKDVQRPVVAPAPSAPVSVRSAVPEGRPPADTVRPPVESRPAAAPVTPVAPAEPAKPPLPAAPERKVKLATVEPPKPVSKPVPVPAPAVAPPAQVVESPAAASADQSAEAGKAPPPRGTLVQGLGRGLDAIAQSARFTSALNLNAVIRFLWVVIVVLFALMIYYVGFVKGGTVPEAVADTGGPGPVVASSSVQAPSLQEIQQQLASRNMFQPPGTGSKPEDKGKLPPVEMKDLKLTGVAWDPGAEGALVALIWDEGRKMTYFVKETESLGDTGIVVQKVHRDRVKLEQAGKEWELR